MTENTVSVPIDVYRFLPGTDAKPRYQRYTLDLTPHTPVLTALLRIRDEVDPTLGLRYSCRSAICGSCAMQINSKSRLACETQVGPELERHGRIVVEPMRNQPVLRDLVVDQSPFWRQYQKIEPHLKL
ncbi:MAG TPA: 2Fe-2S iron-sulfur cluster-binding protein, partial [Thermoplasmata archaeon]|nr:2Fe-2S iron-sulfur cluster-binding protein [Thermoplasmata archaeon]